MAKLVVVAWEAMEEPVSQSRMPQMKYLVGPHSQSVRVMVLPVWDEVLVGSCSGNVTDEASLAAFIDGEGVELRGGVGGGVI